MFERLRGQESRSSGRGIARGARPAQACALAAALTLAPAGPCAATAPDLADLSLEQLGDIEITSVSRKEQRLADAPASIYVITREAIRRSGANTLAEVLRLAPNLQVARISASQYAISARGFNSSTANKLLVLIDGRSIYTPLYSGVFWDSQDVMLADVERIEVLSGPGGTLWGANAVNGVINVITAAAGAGGLAQASAGNLAQAASLRQGWTFDGGALRAYAKYNRRHDSERASGTEADDGFHKLQLGFRGDLNAGGGALTLQGDAYRQTVGLPGGSAPQQFHGGNLLARWVRPLADGASLNLQTFLDRSWRDVPGGYTENLRTLDFDLQYLFAAHDGARWTLGGGHRTTHDDVGNISGLFAFLSAERRLSWTNAFAQYERQLSPSTTWTAGLRAEHNSYTGTEWMPSTRLAFKPSSEVLLWGALSRAVRTPSRIDVEFISYPTPQSPYQLLGGPGFRSEVANTLELGLRAQPSEKLSFSVTLFGSRYSQLRDFSFTNASTYVFTNGAKARVYGAEAWGRYQVSRGWSLQAGLMGLHESFDGTLGAALARGNDPSYQLRLGSTWSLDNGLDIDLSLRRIAALRFTNVPGYTEADARLGWRYSDSLEFALSGRNLLHARHQEFPPATAADVADPTLVGRTAQLTATARF
jgi:iron complex outermembrane receptor protein